MVSPQRLLLLLSLALTASTNVPAQTTSSKTDPYLRLMTQAWQHAQQHGAPARPVLSPSNPSVLSGAVPIAALHAQGFQIVPWNPNDPETIRKTLRTGVDGLITDRPDILQAVLAEERARPDLSPDERARLAHLDVSAHRGGRGLRPENTLPSFESGMDNLITSIETDTGVTTDHRSLIWHDQFLNPESCRRADGAPYTLANRVYIRDISMTEAQRTFICDRLHFGTEQRNDLSLSPVSVAFASHEGMPSPYAPTHAAQLFRFVRFYVEYYRHGAGRSTPHAVERAAAAEKVRFNLETKILPDRLPPEVAGPQNTRVPPEMFQNHTVPPQVFVDTLVGAIHEEHMEARSEIQSFDYRTLILVEEQHPQIPTYYLIDNPKLLSSSFVPESLRQTPVP